MLRKRIVVVCAFLSGCLSCEDLSDGHKMDEDLAIIKETASLGRDFLSVKTELENLGFRVGEPYRRTESEDFIVSHIGLVDELPKSVVFDMTVGKSSSGKLAVTIYVDKNGRVMNIE